MRLRRVGRQGFSVPSSLFTLREEAGRSEDGYQDCEIRLEMIDETIFADDELPNIFPTYFRHDPPGVWEGLDL